MQQEQKKPWRQPEIRVLNLTPEEKARLFPDQLPRLRELYPDHFPKETVASK
jgi:hypothetical protein